MLLDHDLLDWVAVPGLGQDGFIQLLPRLLDDEEAGEDRDSQLEGEDEPARHQVVRVGHHLLHAAQRRPDVHVQGLGGEQPQHAGQDVARRAQAATQCTFIVRDENEPS